MVYGTIPYTVAAVLMVAGAAFPTPPREWKHVLSRLSVGVYLLHPIITGLILFRIPALPDGTPEKALFAIILSALTAAAFWRTPILRRIV